MSAPSSSSSLYAGVKLGKLKLKGVKGKRKGTDSAEAGASTKRPKDEAKDVKQENVDQLEHGGWWQVNGNKEIARGGHVAFEWALQPHCYLSALDNGKFTVSAPREKGAGPSPEDWLSLIRAPDTDWVALKTGFGKYVGVSSTDDGLLMATAEAIGAREKWELVFVDGKCALQSLFNNLFVCFDTDKEGYCHASSKVARDNEVIYFRTNMERAKPVDFTCAADYKKSSICEKEYTLMYQHSKVNLKGRNVIVDLKDKSDVQKGKQEGNLHEVLLDRRMSTKSDKYC